jgi:hypothetical protein
MFICQVCSKQISERIAARRVIAEIRPRLYPPTIHLSKKQKKKKTEMTREEEEKQKRKPPSKGWEIVREVVCCPDCEKTIPKVASLIQTS